MGILRLIIWAVLAWLFYRLYRRIFKTLPSHNKTKVSGTHGTPETNAIDLSGYDVEDADFEDLDEDQKS